MDDLEKLEKFERTRGKLRLPAEIKPCIANLIDGESAAKKGINPFIIACELHRVGKSEKQIEKVLTGLGISYSKMQSAVRSAATGKYSYGCPRLEGFNLCLYQKRKDCWWYERIPRARRTEANEHDFWRYGWPKKLGHAATIVYLALKELEEKKRYAKGGRLFVSRDNLSELTGVSPPWVIKCCERLKKEGLIRFRKGKQHLWYGEASEIWRVIPIPRPKC